MVGQHRSTQRLDPPVVADDEVELRAWLRAFSTRRPRWGWRRAAKELRREGRRINDKRVQRLWREEGLKVPYRTRKKPHHGIGTHVGAFCPIRPNVSWASFVSQTWEEFTDQGAPAKPARLEDSLSAPSVT